MVVGVIAVVAFVCFIWGMIAKTAAVARGLNERSAFWLGFCLWFVGVIIVLASHPERPSAPPPPVRHNAVQPPASMPATQRPVSESTTADELTKLAALRQSGFLSAEEFEEQKRRLLG